jgi:predicted nucleic acid binding AN1-type Zn finger protein
MGAAAANKCTKCNKKIGLVVIYCKCSNKYCTEHRLPESHDCKYNYYNENMKELEVRMGDKVIADKLGERI